MKRVHKYVCMYLKLNNKRFSAAATKNHLKHENKLIYNRDIATANNTGILNRKNSQPSIKSACLYDKLTTAMLAECQLGTKCVKQLTAVT